MSVASDMIKNGTPIALSADDFTGMRETRGSDITPYGVIKRGMFDDPWSCWIWPFATDSNGYGRLRVSGRRLQAHRASYAIHAEPIPVGMETDHICRVRDCINVWHLRLATRSQNCQNISATGNANNASGYRGVYWREDCNKWRVGVRHNGKLIHVGSFDDVHEAGAAARAKREELNFLTNLEGN